MIVHNGRLGVYGTEHSKCSQVRLMTVDFNDGRFLLSCMMTTNDDAVI